MQRAIHKFMLHPGQNTIETNRHAKVIEVHQQKGQICIWMLVDKDEDTVDHHFLVVATGRDFDMNLLEFLGTAHCGPYVWHVFKDNNND